jgi:lipoate-protein ligase B
MGRGGREGSLRVSREELARRGIELFEIARGGDVTWHGPGQLVGYPIVDLERRGRDLHRYLRDLEAVLIAALADWGLAAEREAGRTGVWVGGEKIASLGVAVRRWVGYHGFALNLAPDPAAFDLIHPCGLRDVRMTSVAACCGAGAPSMEQARRDVAAKFSRHFGYDRLHWVEPGRIRSLAAGIENTSRAAASITNSAA